LVANGKLPEPYRIGSRAAWEARDILRMLGASSEIPPSGIEQLQPEAA
jgi:hypothetical protein